MPTLLQIDASPRSESLSSQLASRYTAAWKAQNPDGTVIHHNTTTEKLPYLDEEFLAGFFLPQEQLTDAQKTKMALSDKLVDELLAADVIVVGVPMWNLGIPASLKAWIDLIVRAGKTFAYTPTGVAPLVPAGKKVIVVTTRGGAYEPGTPFAAYDQQEPYLRTAFGFLGMTDQTFIHAENQNRSGDAPAIGRAKAEAAIDALVKLGS